MKLQISSRPSTPWSEIYMSSWQEQWSFDIPLSNGVASCLQRVRAEIRRSMLGQLTVILVEDPLNTGASQPYILRSPSFLLRIACLLYPLLSSSPQSFPLRSRPVPLLAARVTWSSMTLPWWLDQLQQWRGMTILW